MISLDDPLDLNTPDAAAFLAGLQGNILKSHGRDHAAHVFLRLAGDAGTARAWIRELTGRLITSAAVQDVQRRAWKAQEGEGELFASLLLSHAGYVALGVPTEQIPRETGRTYFERGMKDQAETDRRFNDPSPDRWDPTFQGAVHVLVILAHDDREKLRRYTEELQAGAAAVFEAVWVEVGDRLTQVFPDGVNRTIEHFGYEDGISNPALILQDAIREREDRGHTHWDAAAPLSLALLPEPGAPDGFGSFLVFRKLEQDVRGFRGALETIAHEIGASVDEIGAMAVGRFRDGTPVVPATAPNPHARLNDFTFAAADPTGARCPFHAHIRKTNPRGDLPIGLDLERTFRVVRRGITYGERPDLAAGVDLPPPVTGVGLLFMSYQARLDNFAIQQEGSDSNDFASSGVGVDAVIGQHSDPAAQEWPTSSGRRFTMANFVRMIGGEYFFAPSLGFLRAL